MKRWKPGDRDTMSWIILFGCVVAIVFYAVAMTFAYGRDRIEENAAPECQLEIWELFIDGDLIQLPDMTAEECSSAAELLDSQTRPFTRIECRKRFVCRQEL